MALASFSKISSGLHSFARFIFVDEINSGGFESTSDRCLIGGRNRDFSTRAQAQTAMDVLGKPSRPRRLPLAGQSRKVRFVIHPRRWILSTSLRLDLFRLLLS